MEENSSTSEHVLRLSGYYNCLNQVGVNLPYKIAIEKSFLVTITMLLELSDCRHSGNGGPQTCLLAAHGVALRGDRTAHLHQQTFKTLVRG